jgi:hypothetical protein
MTRVDSSDRDDTQVRCNDVTSDWEDVGDGHPNLETTMVVATDGEL